MNESVKDSMKHVWTPKHIWFIRGYAGSGKDTATGFLKEGLESMLGVSVSLSAFADAVKDEVAILYQIPRDLLNSNEGKNRLHTTGRTLRDILIEHGEGEKQHTGDPAVWSHRVFPTEGCCHWILSDWRFRAEYDALCKRFPSATLHTVHICRPHHYVLPSYTEHELDDIPASIILDNSGSLLYLRRQIQDLIEDMSGTSIIQPSSSVSFVGSS